jgi:hypothetical protein
MDKTGLARSVLYTRYSLFTQNALLHPRTCRFFQAVGQEAEDVEQAKPPAFVVGGTCDIPANSLLPVIRWLIGSATDAVAEVGGIRRVDHPNDLQIDPRGQDIEQPTATAEEYRNQMDLQLIQHSGLDRPLRRVCAMHHHISFPSGSLRLCHRADDSIIHIGNEGVFGDGGVRRSVTDDKDRDTVMISFPVIDLLHSATANQDCTRRIAFVYEARSPARIRRVGGCCFEPVPIVQTHELIAAGIAGRVVRACDISVQ